jgi:hypothetical protein
MLDNIKLVKVVGLELKIEIVNLDSERDIIVWHKALLKF